ncbi:hypothetical protein [Streptococcus suis]|uniref:hypothetical protein n=1 Tax=Streptococcus suis TaxID=1307 RepID=UPI000CF63B2C|nr:hypothetical protein [Streptococcus suis]
MSQKNIIDNYEELVMYTEEIRASLELIHDWLSRKPKFEARWSYHDLIVCHDQYFALLNLVRHRMDSLINEHQKIIDNEYRGE